MQLKFLQGLSSKLASKPKEEGTIYYTTDESKLYVDTNGTRQAVNAEYANIIKETNAGLDQKFWRGTQAEYNAIGTKDDTTMYIITDGDNIDILAEAKSYTDTKVSEIDTTAPVSAHNISTTAHTDIRIAVSEVSEKLNWITF